MSFPTDTINIELSQIQFDEFEKRLKDNPVEENEALKKLLARETTWASDSKEKLDNT